MTMNQDHISFQIDNPNNLFFQKIDSHCDDGDDTAPPPKGYYRTKMKEIHLQSKDLPGQMALDTKMLAVMIGTPSRQPPTNYPTRH